jgi:hypothetical protein
MEFVKKAQYNAEIRFVGGRLWYDGEQWLVYAQEYGKLKKVVMRTASEEDAVAKAIELAGEA